MAEEKVLRVPAEQKGLTEMSAFVSSLLDAYDCSPEVRTRLRMAVEEVYVNVTLYAYPEGDGWAELRGSVEDGVVTLVLIDGGMPFNPLEKPDPDTMLSGEEREIGGLGIFMVKTMVDEMEYDYRDGCNRLTLRKRIS